MSRLIVVILLILGAATIGSSWVRYHISHAAVSMKDGTAQVVVEALSPPAPDPVIAPVPLLVTEPTPEPTPTPEPITIPRPTIYIWFNSEVQAKDVQSPDNANKSLKENYTILAFFSYEVGKSEESHRLVKCSINREYVDGFIHKSHTFEMKVYSDKCKELQTE